MQKVTEITGGKFYLLDHIEELKNIYADIDKLEKSILPVLSKRDQPMRYQRISLYPYLIVIGLGCLLLSVLLKAFLLRTAP
jgi:Ca-activated chloride channel family protein